MFVLLLYRVDKETSNICKLHAGEHVIGREPLLQCTSKKVSRNHGIIRVTEEEGVFLISTHKNPCFLRAQNTQHMTIVKNGCSVSLSNGDKIALLPDEYWFKVQIVSTLDNENNNVLNSQPVINNTSNIPTSNSTPLDKTDTSISTSVLHDTTDLNISGCKRNHPDQIGEVQRKKTKINDKVPDISTSQRNTCNQENFDEISIVRSPSPELSGIENIDSRLSPNVENNEACNNVLDENCSSRCSSPDLLQDFPCESNVLPDISHRNSVQSEQANLNNSIPDISNVNNVQSEEANSSVSSKITDQSKNILSQTCENSANVILNDLCENVQPNLDRHENLEDCNAAATSSLTTRNVESLNIKAIPQTSRDLNLEAHDARDSEENDQQIDNKSDNQDANNEVIKLEVDNENISVKEVQYENDNEVEVKIEKKNDNDNEIQNVTKVENVEEDNVDNPDNGQDNQPSTSGNNATRRERCWYGTQCYRKNPAHKTEYSHPGDDDYNSDPNDPRRICAYGANCYRRNKLHRQQYWHPNSIRDRTAANSTTGNSTSPTLRKRRKTSKDTKLKSDSEDDYDYSDPFINDGSSDEYQAETDDSDSDYNDDDDFEENSEENRVLLREARKFTRGGKNKD